MKIFFAVLILIAVIVGVWLWYSNLPKQNQTPLNPINKVSYLCQDAKTIDATYYKGTPVAVKPGEPPVPTGSVDLILSGGKKLILPQTISADGGRYANSDESIIFWGKGNGAFILENNVQTYTGCIIIASNPGDLPQVYADAIEGFSVRYPAGYSVNTSYKYQALGPGKDIGGIKFIISPEMATGTNLSSYDTGVSVEAIPAIQNCSADLFLDQNIKAQTITDNGIEYSIASTTDAAAGNRYEERVWAFPGTNPCIAVRYLIHYGNIQNYPAGAVREFDQDSLLKQFDEIRRSLILL